MGIVIDHIMRIPIKQPKKIWKVRIVFSRGSFDFSKSSTDSMGIHKVARQGQTWAFSNHVGETTQSSE